MIPIDRSIRNLEWRIEAVYSSAYNMALAREKRHLTQMLREAPADLDREQYLQWLARRHDGTIRNISAEIARSGDTASRMINRESLSLFNGGYRDAFSDLTRQIRGANLTANFTMINNNALNAVFNGEMHGLGRGAFEQVVLLDRNLGNTFYQSSIRGLTDTSEIIRRLQNSLAEGIILGDGIPQISLRIKKIMGGGYNATRTARTETVCAYNQGAHLAALQANEEYDIPMSKKWISVADDRTRQRRLMSSTTPQ